MLTPDIKSRVRRHLGFPNVATIATYFLGVPAAMEPFYILEAAMDSVLPVAEKIVVKMVRRLDKIAEIIFDDTDTLVASSVGNIDINPEQFEKLIQRYRWFQGELANALGAYVNSFDKRFGSGAGMGGINVRVG